MEEREMKSAPRRLSTMLLAGIFLAGGFVSGQNRDPYGNPVGYDDRQYDDDSRYGPDDIRQTVARISDIDGRVSYARGDDPDDWQAADRNVPVTIGDRLYTDPQSRVELQIAGGDYVRLGSGADLAVLNLTDDTRQFALKSGVGSFRVRSLDDWQFFEVDTPNAAVTFETPGNYRIDVDERGGTRVSVRDGRARVAAGGGQVPIRAGDAIVIDGFDDPRYDFVALDEPDGWDRWVRERDARISGARSYRYVSADIAGVDDLDAYGRWENLPSYGWAWSPTRVAAGWAPYRVGKWIWQDPWGWTWLSYEPWGWAPYHYGRWVFTRSRWCWVPVSPRVTYVPYYPALVAFTAGGPGWSASFSVSSGGYVGWFPLAPREPFIPWWGRPRVAVNVTNITYVNRTYVTVVNHNTFVSGGLVTSAVVRDTAVVRQVAAAPVLRGPLPVVPTQGALRVASRPAAAPRPPAAVVARPVVARVAPPPAPPRFDQKVAVIRENRGAPVLPDEAARLAVRERGRPQTVTQVRPAVEETGRVKLAPRSPSAQAAQPTPQPVASAPVRGRPVATSQRPVAQAPVSAPAEARRARPPQREEPPASRQAEPSEVNARPAPETRQPQARVEGPAPPPPAAEESTREARAREDARTREEARARENDRSRARQRPTASAPPVVTPRADRDRMQRESAAEAERRSSRERQEPPRPTARARRAPSETSSEPAREARSMDRDDDRPPPSARQAPDRSREEAREQPQPSSVERQRQPPEPTPANSKAKERGRKKDQPKPKPTPEQE
jgi:hypothetical protein